MNSIRQGITAFRQMAKALELSVENLLEMCDQKPLEDARKAELYG
jgi:cytidylate kinase